MDQPALGQPLQVEVAFGFRTSTESQLFQAGRGRDDEVTQERAGGCEA